ncbi:uncharacterized protein LOC121390690 isoform X2 [Gigantopelta aegis]|uniref:uncharacterized protein LOC121390690 isoform X2 n=1 Tax=Gigantopelta aegis TaxID=1735272 RepID=UPI001B88B7A9|nr:uncharacterized protein LOC121390690 isoform X2 [Gigantopelta aegis]
MQPLSVFRLPPVEIHQPAFNTIEQRSLRRSSKMKAVKTCLHNTVHNRKMRRYSFWLVCATLFCLVLFFNHFTIHSISKYITKYDASKVVENTDGTKDRVRHQRSVDMPSELSLPKLNIESQNAYQDLRSDLSPSIVHYIWSKRGYFEFRHYLALKRVIDIVNPDAVFFHFTYLPETDAEQYYMWFNRIQKEVSHFVMHKINTTNELTPLTRVRLAVMLVHEYGGIYVPESSIVTGLPVSLRSFSFVSGLSSADIAVGFSDGLLIGKKRGFDRPETTDQVMSLLDLEDEHHTRVRSCCSEPQTTDGFNAGAVCINIQRPLHPKDIWFNDTQIALLGKLTMYGVSQVKPAHDAKRPIPRISHYVCVSACQITFLGYLSMLSAVYVAGFSYVYIHGPVTPSGDWWERLSKRPQFVYLYREIHESTRDGRSISESLGTNLMRLHILLKYGGVYQDANTLWTQSIPDDRFEYEAVVSPDWHTHGAWPESINHGVMMAKENSEYIRQLHTMFVTHREDPPWFVDHYLSYRIIEMQPELVFIDPHLQVKCLNHNCHPTWQPGYRSTLLQNKPGQDFTWQNETISVHWVDSFPDLNTDMVRYTSGLAIEISRFILASAGVPLNSI